MAAARDACRYHTDLDVAGVVYSMQLGALGGVGS